MSYKAIKIELNTNNQGIRTAIGNLLPKIGDSRVHPVDFKSEEVYVSCDNLFCVVADIKFLNEIERDDLLKDIKALNGIIHQCESGSETIGYESREDEGLPIVIDSILRKD